MGRIVTRGSLSARGSPAARPAPSRRGARPRGGTPGAGRRSCGRAAPAAPARRRRPGPRATTAPSGPTSSTGSSARKSPATPVMPAASSDACRSRTARTAPSSSTQPAAGVAGVAAARTAGRWAGGPVAGNSVPTALPGQRGGGLRRRGDDDGDAGVRGDQGRLDLGRHAAGADAVAAGRAERDRAEVGGAVHGVDQPGRSGARVAVVDAVDVGEQDQRVGPGDVRHERGQPVVVAEADLLGGHRVVLVDDRQRRRGPAAAPRSGGRCGSGCAG